MVVTEIVLNIIFLCIKREITFYLYGRQNLFQRSENQLHFDIFFFIYSKNRWQVNKEQIYKFLIRILCWHWKIKKNICALIRFIFAHFFIHSEICFSATHAWRLLNIHCELILIQCDYIVLYLFSQQRHQKLNVRLSNEFFLPHAKTRERGDRQHEESSDSEMEMNVCLLINVHHLSGWKWNLTG